MTAVGLAGAAATAFAVTGLLLAPFLSIAVRGGLARPNYAGRVIPTAAGVPFSVGTACGLLAAAVWAAPLLPLHRGAVWASAALGFGLIGLCDDLLADRSGGGLAGHWRAWRSGELTSGGYKALAGGLLALGLGVAQTGPGWLAVLDGALIALAANGWNLLDLRPGRALKAFFGAAAGLAAAGAWGLVPALAAALAVWPRDVRGESMLGDAGANVLGALIGVAAAGVLPWWGRCTVLGGLAALHVAAERGSISAWIESRPLLAWLDRIGRR